MKFLPNGTKEIKGRWMQLPWRMNLLLLLVGLIVVGTVALGFYKRVRMNANDY